MSKKMLIDATHPEETRVVVLDGNKVEEFDFESVNKRQLAGNIYLAKVTRVEPSLQAAFVEYGGNRHGFLAFSEIHPDYYQIPVADREALLAEEASQASDANSNGEESERNGGQRRSRSSRGGRRQRRSSSSESVSGLEVIDIDEGEGEAEGDPRNVPAGLEVTHSSKAETASDESNDAAPRARSARRRAAEPKAEDPANAPSAAKPEADAASGEDQPGDTESRQDAPASPVEEVAASTESAEAGKPAPGDGGDASSAPDPAGSVTATGAEADRKADADEAGAHSGEVDDAEKAEGEDTPPRYMAESAGLDEERLTEEIEPDQRSNRRHESADSPIAESGNEGASTESQGAASARAEEKAPEPTETTEPAETTKTADGAEAGDQNSSDKAASEAEAAGAAATANPSGDDEAAEESQPARTGRRRPRRRSDRRSGAAARDSDGNAEGKGNGRSRRNGASDRNGNGDNNGANNGNGDEVEDIGADDALEEAAGVRARLSRRYKIQDVIKVRQIMLVQVVKEERGTKGAALTTYLSLAGRYCVLMPNTARGGGISRKITNISDRKRLRDIAGELDVPGGMGLIVRTAGAERTRAEIRRDYEFLLRQWERVRDLTLKSIAPTLIYEEGSLIKRSIRDLYSREIEQVLVEGEAGYREAKEYMRVLMPSHARNVQPYTDPTPLFSRYQVESYLNGMFSPRVTLKSGGYLVIGITEALVAIDVNSGRATKQSSIEDTALHTNLEAAEEVARQLRLRDLAGLIVIDFIDMDENRNNRAVEQRLKEKLKSDRARIQIGRISAFGLLEMSRQRLRPGMLEASTKPCPHCHGSGLIRSDESLALAILREVEEEALRGRTAEINVHAPVEIANYLVNIKRQHISEIEARSGISVMITAEPDLISPDYEVERCKGERRQPAPAARDVVSASTVAMPDVAEAADEVEAASATPASEPDAPQGERDAPRGDDDDRSRRRRGRRGGRRRRADSQEPDAEQRSADASEERDAADMGGEQGGADGNRRRSRRGRGRRRRGRRNDEQQQSAAQADAASGEAEQGASAGEDGQKPEGESAGQPAPAPTVSSDAEDAEPVTASPPKATEATDAAAAPAAPATQPDEAAAPPAELQADHGAAAAARQDAEAAPSSAADTAGAADADASPATDGRSVPAGNGGEAAASKQPDADKPRSEAKPERAKKPQPKRRGWWSLGL